MKSDIEIAQEVELEELKTVGDKIGLPQNVIEPWGRGKAKLDMTHRCFSEKKGHIILVTAMSPTPYGEGKTTTAIGLNDALWRLGKKSVVGLREPSMGPVFGMKGGAAGGGHSQVLPMEDINLHFTGDIHAVGAAHNLLAAILNNHMHFGNELDIDPRNLSWHRVVDMNDRSLRNMVVGLGGRFGGMLIEDRFDITAASEIMAVLCLAGNYRELQERLDRIVVAYNDSKEPVLASDLKITGAMAALLKDAMRPNLVQTIEGNPALIHGGPFANIAHGTSSLMAASAGVCTADYYVTEAGFGADLGAEKFFNIFCRSSRYPVSAVVLVATTRALKYHGGVKKDAITKENLKAITKGFANLERHVENIRGFGFNPVVAINAAEWDVEGELSHLEDLCRAKDITCVRSYVHARGGEGGTNMAQAVLESIEEKMPEHTYDLEDTIKEKITKVAKTIYRAGSVVFSPEAKKQMDRLEALGYGNLPICIAKTQYSFSDFEKKLGAPHGFKFNIREMRLSAGAGFIIPVSGTIMTMPGLPRKPSAELIEMDEDNRISGLF